MKWGDETEQRYGLLTREDVRLFYRDVWFFWRETARLIVRAVVSIWRR